MLRTIAMALGFLAAAHPMVAAAPVPGDDPAGHVAQRVAAVPAGLEDLGPLLEELRAQHGLPAMGGAIVRGGELVAIGATGVRKAGGTAAVTVGDLWHIGSCTKAMTATLVAGLVEEGRLAWGQSVGEFFRGRGVEVDAGWDEATLRQLLDHRAGVPGNLDAGGLWGRLWKFKGPPRESRMVLVRGVLSQPPRHEPGTQYEYANGGFAIAGAMAEEVTDTAWEDLMRSRLFTPLGIGSAGFGAPGMRGVEEQPWGHTSKGEARSPGPGADNPPAIGPGGTVHLSLADWAKFIAAHARGEREGAILLRPESYKALHTPAEGPGQRYGGGWVVATRAWARGRGPDGSEGPGRVLMHTGSNTMWFAVAWIAPERDFAVLVTCNQGGDAAAKGCDQAAAALIQRATAAGESTP